MTPPTAEAVGLLIDDLTHGPRAGCADGDGWEDIADRAITMLRALSAVPDDGLGSSSPKSEDTHRATDAAVLVPKEPTPAMLEPFARVLCSALSIDPDEPEAPHGEWPTWYGQCAPLAVAYRDALAVSPHGAIEGWASVPKVPTGAMIEAGYLPWINEAARTGRHAVRDIYAAMLQAAPSPSVPTGDAEGAVVADLISALETVLDLTNKPDHAWTEADLGKRRDAWKTLRRVKKATPATPAGSE